MREKNTQVTINQRINFLIDYFESGNKSAFGRHVDMKSGVVGDLVGGRLNKPSFDALLKILSAYPSVNTDWLILGKGEPFHSDVSHDPQKTSLYKQPEDQIHVSQEEKPAPYGNAGVRVLTVQVGTDEQENIEFVGTKAAAGYGAGGFLQREFIGNLPHFRLPDAAYRNGSFRCFQVSGESMQPTLHNGDWVICRYIERWDRDIRDNRVYVVVTDDGVRIKRLLNRLTERGNLALNSDNVAFSVDFLDGSEVREVWEAVGKLSRQFVNPRFDITTELARHNAEIAELFGLVKRLQAKS